MNKTVKLYVSKGNNLYIVYGNKVEYWSSYFTAWRISAYSVEEIAFSGPFGWEYLGEL